MLSFYHRIYYLNSLNAAFDKFPIRLLGFVDSKQTNKGDFYFGV